MIYFTIGENIKINEENNNERDNLEISVCVNEEESRIKYIKYKFNSINNYFEDSITDENIFNSIITNMKIYKDMIWDEKEYINI